MIHGHRGTLSVLALVMLLPAPAVAQEVAAPIHVGILRSSDQPAYNTPAASFASELSVSLKHAQIHDYEMGGDRDRGNRALQEMRALGCSIIYAIGAKAAYLATRSGTDIPVVFTSVLDWRSYRSSLARSHVAGVANEIPADVQLTQISFLSPSLRRVIVITAGRGQSAVLDDLVVAGKMLSLEIVALPVADLSRLSTYARTEGDVDTVILPLADPQIYTVKNFLRMVALSRKHRLPLIAASSQFVEAGALMGINVNYSDLGSQAASLAVQILEGRETPQSLGVAAPVGTSLVLNEAAASAIRFTLPEYIVSLADDVYAKINEVSGAAIEGESDAVKHQARDSSGERDPWKDAISEAEYFAVAERITVVSATKTEQTIEEAPAIITVVSARQIRSWGYQSLTEVLRHVVGFYVIDDHILPNAAVRGVSGGLRGESGLVKVMIDGHSVAFRSTASNWIGAELIPLSAVDHIEIIRGPASALYGADAFLGIISVITRSGAQLDGAEIELGSSLINGHPGGGVDFAVGTRRDKWEAVLAGRVGYEDRSGLSLPESSPAPRLPGGREIFDTATDLTHETLSALGKLTYHFSKDADVTITSYVSGFERGGEFADWLQLGNGAGPNGTTDENRVGLYQTFVDTRASLSLSDSWSLNLDALFFAGGKTDADRIEVGSDIYYVERDLGYRGVELEASTLVRVGDLSMFLGLGLIADDEQLPSTLHVLKVSAGGLSAGDIRESTSTRQERKLFLNPGATLQGIWTPGSKVSLTGGLRYDYHSIYGNQLSGRAAVVHSPSPRLNLKLLYGSAFKAPSPQLLYGVPLVPGGLKGNENLAPQFVHTVEGQIAYALRRGVSLSTGLSYSLLLDKAEFVQVGVNKIARNVSEVGTLAWENQLTYRYRELVEAYGNLELQHAVRSVGQAGYVADLIGSQNVVYPNIIASIGTMFTPTARLHLGVEGLYLGERRASDTNILEAGEPYRLPHVFLLDASLGYRLTTSIGDARISFLARNLTGDRGPDPGFGGVDYPLLAQYFMIQFVQSL